MSEPDKPTELQETRKARMLNFAAFGTASTASSVTAMFAAISLVNSHVASAVVFGLSLLPHIGLLWLNSRHLKAHDSKATPYIETVERARQRCRGAFTRLVAPAVVVGAAFVAVNIADPNPTRPDFPQPVLRK